MRKFWSDTSANVAIMMALGAVVLIGAAGAALDMVRTNDTRTKLNAAADAAALGAVSVIRTADGSKTAEAVAASAKVEAKRIWDNNLPPAIKKLVPNPKIIVAKTSEEWTAKVEYTGKLKTTLMSLLGVKDTPLDGVSIAATGSQASYWNFSFVVDTSSSMGIGATQADMNNMLADPGIGCMFACHWDATGSDSLSKSRAAGYKLRLDVVDDAVDSTLNAIKAKGSIKPQAALYGLSNGIADLVPQTTNLNTVRDHDIQIALMTESKGNTNYRAALEELTTKIGVSGDGSTAAKARDVVFIVTDGIHDSETMEPNAQIEPLWRHFMGTVDPAFCEKLKSNGAVVGVLYIDYIIPGGYEGGFTTFQSDILPNMQKCASPGFFYNATSSADIEGSMKKILENAFLTDARLTQ